MSHIGKVHDDGDEGMRGQRIGRLNKVDDSPEHNVLGDVGHTDLPFNNGRFGSPRYFRVNDIVSYEHRTGRGNSHYAEVNYP